MKPRRPTLAPPRIDAWLALVLKTMGTEELQREAVNPLNTTTERAVMRAELERRGVQS